MRLPWGHRALPIWIGALLGALVLALTLGMASPARADNTVRHYGCGWDFYYGSWCQVTLTHATSEHGKQMLVAGSPPAAVASYYCGLMPEFGGACVYYAAKEGPALRDAVNEAHNNTAKCVAVKIWSSAAGNMYHHNISAVNCYLNIPGGGDGGGGGGGGGGSWRTPGGDGPHQIGGGGGGSWKGARAVSVANGGERGSW